MQASSIGRARFFTRRLTIDIPDSTLHRRPPHKQLMKKHELADELLEMIPMKYKKKLRVLIQAYEEERLKYAQTKIVTTPTSKKMVQNFQRLLRLSSNRSNHGRYSRRNCKSQSRLSSELTPPKLFRRQQSSRKQPTKSERNRRFDRIVEDQASKQRLDFDGRSCENRKNQLRQQLQEPEQQLAVALSELEQLKIQLRLLGQKYEALANEHAACAQSQVSKPKLLRLPTFQKEGYFADPTLPIELSDVDSPLSPTPSRQRQAQERNCMIEHVGFLRSKVRSLLKRKLKKTEESMAELDYGKEKVVERRKVRKLFRLILESESESQPRELEQLMSDLGLAALLGK